MTGRVLVLDQGYQPHRIVSWQRAITMWFQDKVEIVEEYDEDIRSVNIVIKMPAVVRLLKAVSGRKRQVKFSRINLAIRDDFSCQYCLAPSHKVLTAALNWVSLGDLVVGDRLVGFDEERVSSGGRRFKEALVTSHVFEKKPVYKVTLDSGEEFIATAEHKWLSRVSSKGSSYKWSVTSELLGRRLPKLFDVWKPNTSYEAGWLAGMFDGEGWIHNTAGVSLGIAQNPGPTLDKIKRILADQGYVFGESVVNEGRDCVRLVPSGNYADSLKLLGTIRPERLIQQLSPSTYGRVQTGTFSKVVNVEYVGVLDVVNMATSTGTFIADGYPQHNCGTKHRLKHLTYDHVVPRKDGGKTTWENIVMACRLCNSRKGHKSVEGAGMTLRKKPMKPTWLPANVFRIEDTQASIPEQWVNFIYWHGALEEGS